MWSVKSSDINDRLVISGHTRTTTIDYQTRWHRQVNLCRRVRKIRRSHLCRLWRIHYGINVSRQTVHPKLVQRGYWARGIPLPTRIAVSHRVLDFAGLGGVTGCCSDTGYMLSPGREGAAHLIVKMADILSVDYRWWEPPSLLYSGTGSMWWRLSGGRDRYSQRKKNVIGGSGWKRQRLHVAGHSGNLCLPHQGSLMETTFGCKTFAHIWLLQWNNFLKHMGWCWYHDPLAP